MKLILLKKSTQKKYKFNNKYELLIFTQNQLNNSIFSNKQDEKLKNKILKCNNLKNITIFELLSILFDFKLIEEA